MSVDEKYLQTVMRTLSHDMGSALRAASGFSKLLKDNYGDKLDEKALAWLDLIQSEGDVAQRKLKVFSQYARLYGADELSDRCDLNTAYQYALDDLSLKPLLAANPGVKLSVTTLPVISGSVSMWQSYFSLLIANVVHYARKGRPVSCRVYAENKVTADLNEQVIIIEDDGVGLSMDRAAKALQPYRSLYDPETDQEGVASSLGMGLTLAKRIVEAHQGVFLVCARPDGSSGLRIEARLPV